MRLGIWAGADALGTGITWCPQGRRVWDGNGFREPWIIFRKTISRMEEEGFRGAESRGRYWALSEERSGPGQPLAPGAPAISRFPTRGPLYVLYAE